MPIAGPRLPGRWHAGRVRRAPSRLTCPPHLRTCARLGEWRRVANRPIALAATAVFAVAGALGGLLIDEYGGVVGALEWVLRTLVVISAAVALAAAFLLVLRLRRRGRPRPLGWALTVVAALAFAFLVVQPVAFAVYLTHLPTRRAVHDADLGAKQPVTLTNAHGLRLRGWYVPSRNGAAVAVLHGTGSNRLGVADHGGSWFGVTAR